EGLNGAFLAVYADFLYRARVRRGMIRVKRVERLQYSSIERELDLSNSLLSCQEAMKDQFQMVSGFADSTDEMLLTWVSCICQAVKVLPDHQGSSCGHLLNKWD